MTAKVVAVHQAATHCFSKVTTAEIQILAGHGVEGDALRVDAPREFVPMERV